MLRLDLLFLFLLYIPIVMDTAMIIITVMQVEQRTYTLHHQLEQRTIMVEQQRTYIRRHQLEQRTAIVEQHHTYIQRHQLEQRTAMGRQLRYILEHQHM